MPKKPTPTEVMPVTELAGRIGVSEENIRAQLQKGDFPVGFAFQSPGGSWRYIIPRGEVEMWLQGSKYLLRTVLLSQKEKAAPGWQSR